MRRRRRDNKDLPLKTRPEEFGGGRYKGFYMQYEVRQRMCSRAGCDRPGYAAWSACCDDNIQRPLCAECDVELNYKALLWHGDPDAEAKITAYANRVEAEVGHALDLSWLEREAS